MNTCVSRSRGRARLQVPDGRHAIRPGHGQVAREAESLPLEPAGHQRQQDGRRARVRGTTRSPSRVGRRDEPRARVGHGGSAGLGHEAQGPALAKRREQGGDIGLAVVCSSSTAMPSARHRPRVTAGGKESPRGLRVLDHEVADARECVRGRGAGSTASGSPSSARVTGIRKSAAGPVTAPPRLRSAASPTGR